jgi:hypothetical protein
LNIFVFPLEPQPEPQNLGRLKNEIMKQWPMTRLLDMLKEVDLRISFANQCKTASFRETLDRTMFQKRLLLDLHAHGTNTGI